LAADDTAPRFGRETSGQARSCALASGLHVAEVLVDAAAPLSIGDIAKATGLESHTVHRLLQGLIENGYAVRHTASKRITAGPRAYFPKRLYHPLSELGRQVHARLADLRDAHGETTAFVLFVGMERVIVDSAQGSEHLGPYYDDTWMDAPLHGSMSGKIMLMDMTEAERRLYLGSGPYPGIADKTTTDPAEFERQLDELRAKGYGSIQDTLFAGVTAIAAPVRARDRIIGCLVVAGRGDLKATADLVARGTPALRPVAHLLGV